MNQRAAFYLSPVTPTRNAIAFSFPLSAAGRRAPTAPDRRMPNCPASAEQVDLPFVEQVALVRRHLRHHNPETLALATSLPSAALHAGQWLRDNRAAWGIENGLHQPLDVSHLDDLCRVRHPQSMRVVGMFRRFSHSLCMHWRSRQKRPGHKTTTDFFAAMNAEHHRYAICCIHARQPSFLTTS